MISMVNDKVILRVCKFSKIQPRRPVARNPNAFGEK